ncbi:transmembrane signal receptor [Lithospermum erythrorhizon]|uniref:Transmembrane signal receptor n=1 Tax=Lithospermum erythrorhizon TaxID=34254 RepID=A0AAV3PN97_LITER
MQCDIWEHDTQSKAQSWDLDVSLDYTIQKNHDLQPNPTPTPKPTHEHTSSKALSKPQTELRVYSRRQRETNLEVPNLQHNPESDHVLDPLEDDQSGNDTMNLDVSIALRKGTRTRHPVDRFISSSYTNLSSSFKAFTVNLSDTVIPRDIKEALTIPAWKNAYNENGKTDSYKARLVAKGFTQTYGIDFSETFAPVTKLNTIRVLLSLVANQDWKLHQLDIKNVFLNGELEEEVYMIQPPGFEKDKSQVCKLRKSLYGLKQSPRAWFHRFSKAVKIHGYKQSQVDHTLFIKHTGKDKLTILIVYVDDIIITGNNATEAKNIKELLAREFEVKNLGMLKYFLGIEIA